MWRRLRALGWLAVRLAIATALAGAVAGALLVAIGVTDRRAPADLGVILATRVAPDGTLSPRLRARCASGLEVYRAGLVPRLMVSGGMDPNGYDEAACMKAWLVAHGVPDSAIVADPRGVDTWHTALDARAYLDAHHLRSAMIVTQGFHVPRTRFAFARVGIARLAWVHARFWEPRDLYSIARELPALAKYAVRRVPREA